MLKDRSEEYRFAKERDAFRESILFLDWIQCFDCDEWYPSIDSIKGQYVGKKKWKLHRTYRYRCNRCRNERLQMVQCCATQRHRANKTNTEATLTVEQWKFILSFYNYKCAYCGKSIIGTLHQEHIVPVKGANGPYNIFNIVPACQRCNSSKLKMRYWEFLNRRSFTISLKEFEGKHSEMLLLAYKQGFIR